MNLILNQSMIDELSLTELRKLQDIKVVSILQTSTPMNLIDCSILFKEALAELYIWHKSYSSSASDILYDLICKASEQGLYRTCKIFDAFPEHILAYKLLGFYEDKDTFLSYICENLIQNKEQNND